MLEADVPPPTPYDLQQRSHQLLPEDRSLLGQLGRTVIALALVVLLLYALARWLLPAWVRGLKAAPGAQLRVVERLPLDHKHALVLVEVAQGGRLLLGVGDGAIAPVAAYPAEPEPKSAAATAGAPGPRGFAAVLGATRGAKEADRARIG